MFIALIVASFACADPIPKDAPEPDWMIHFRKVYQLKEGEYVKRVAPPYIRERVDFILGAYAPPKNPKADAQIRELHLNNAKLIALFTEQNGTRLTKQMVMSSMGLADSNSDRKDDNLLEVSLAVAYLTGLHKPEFIIDPRFAKDPLFVEGNLTVHGDFVVRKNAPIEKLAEQLEAILRKECKVPCKLRVDMVEEEVYVASGEFKLTPPVWRATSKSKRLKSLIDVYSTEEALNPEYDHYKFETWTKKADTVESGDHDGNPVSLMRFLGWRINKRVVWDMELSSEIKMTYCNHKLKNPTPQEKAIDNDPEKILKNMTAQTGLTFKKEKRKVPVLVIYPSELK